MTLLPRLLRNRNATALPDTIFSDLQINQILSKQTAAVLQRPCNMSEIAHRNELFVLLDNHENREYLENILAVLSNAERTLRLLNSTKTTLERYYRQADVLESYVSACEILASAHMLGDLFADISEYFSSDNQNHRLAAMKESAKNIRAFLKEMNTALLSFSDKNWITPNYDAVSELELISVCAENLGLTLQKRKQQNIRIGSSLSDAICRLYADNAAQIEAEISEYSDVDFHEPISYIPEIRFFLEIHALIEKANNMGVPHTIAKIANTPIYKAKELYDISLLVKDSDNIVPNDANFLDNEPFYFVLGANGGGKTTYLRAVGINLILFLAGCPVFAKNAEIYPFEIVMTHFPKDERFDGIGRLNEEQIRTDDILKSSQNQTAFLLFNETFSGTDDKRGFELLKNTAAQISANRHFGLYVTHFHEVMSLDYPVLSAEIDFASGNKRTFRIVRAKGCTSSYAADILKKYNLDKDSLYARRCGNGS